jgi:hypothetical protein
MYRVLVPLVTSDPLPLGCDHRPVSKVLAVFVCDGVPRATSLFAPEADYRSGNIMEEHTR